MAIPIAHIFHKNTLKELVMLDIGRSGLIRRNVLPIILENFKSRHLP